MAGCCDEAHPDEHHDLMQSGRRVVRCGTRGGNIATYSCEYDRVVPVLRRAEESTVYW